MRLFIALLVAAAALAVPVSALAGAQHAKFDFEGVTFPDGTTGTIYVGSKQTGGGSQFTNCGYEADDGTFLGNYGDSTFSSTDADTLSTSASTTSRREAEQGRVELPRPTPRAVACRLAAAIGGINRTRSGAAVRTDRLPRIGLRSEQ